MVRRQAPKTALKGLQRTVIRCRATKVASFSFLFTRLKKAIEIGLFIVPGKGRHTVRSSKRVMPG